MTTLSYDPRLSAPECQLSKAGSERSNNILKRAVQVLETNDLSMLEDELSFYAQTGLIGVRMSRLLGMLKTRILSRVA
jgi:hypothetical protein